MIRPRTLRYCTHLERLLIRTKVEAVTFDKNYYPEEGLNGEPALVGYLLHSIVLDSCLMLGERRDWRRGIRLGTAPVVPSLRWGGDGWYRSTRGFSDPVYHCLQACPCMISIPARPVSSWVYIVCDVF